MSNITAVIYDVDGTLIDTEPLHVQAWGQALATLGFSLGSLSSAFVQTMAGKKPIVIAQGMVDELHLVVSADDLLNAKTSHFIALVNTSLRAMPGAVSSVHRFKDAGYKLGIGTSLDRPFIDVVLQKLELTNTFDVLVTGDKISKGKPDPETYITVAEKLGVSPIDCVVFEDAQTGVAAAKASGAFCIAVGNVDAAPQVLSEADIVVRSLDEVTEDVVMSLTVLQR